MRRAELVRPAALVAGLAALLVALGALQYRWLAQVSAAERERLTRDAQRRADALAQDFDREITRAYLMLQVPAGARAGAAADGFARRWDRWTARAPHPGMVSGVFFVEPRRGTPRKVSRFDPGARAFVPAAWPPELAALRTRLEAAPPGEPPPMPLLAEVPALVSPVPDLSMEAAAPGPPGVFKHVLLAGERTVTRPPPHWPAWAYTVVVLDRAYLAERLFPTLAARHVRAAGGPEYEVTLLGTAPAGALWASAAPRVSGDASAPALQVRFDELERTLVDGLADGSAARGNHFQIRLATGAVMAKGAVGGESPSGWRVVLAHRAGSVNALVAGLHRRNLAVSFGILGVLAASMALVIVAGQRARRLAERQMEFVAGVSHELRTPVAVIRSAAENLADGVVAEAGQVRRYGAVIRDQGERLTAMVEQVLALAGVQARARPPQRIAPGALVRAALEDVGEPLPSDGALQLEVDPDLPDLGGDPDALRRAVGNLVANARRHAQGSPLRVRARRAGDGGVAIEVEDRGPGIDPADLPHVFEPFYRGRRALAEQVPGSGLGLAVVRGVTEAHGGRASVVSRPGDGATFTLHLPASAPR